MAFTNDNIDDVRRELEVVLRKYGIASGTDFKVGRITYNKNSFKTSIECFSTEETGAGAEESMFARDCKKFGIPADWYNSICNFNGEKYRIIAVNTRARKYPLEMKHIGTGKGIKTTVDHAFRNLEDM